MCFEQVGPGAIVVVVFGFRRFWTFGVLDRLVGPKWSGVLSCALPPHVGEQDRKESSLCFRFLEKNQKIDLSTPIDRKHSLPDDWCAQN